MALPPHWYRCLMEALTPAELVFEQENPRSVEFGDVYASSEGGLEEARHVFHDSIDLTGRWADRDHFTIIETGFGTGLNFLATAELYQEVPNRPQYLDYVSIEKHPVKPADLVRFYSRYPNLRALSASLIEHYPPLVSGFHKLWLVPGRVSLSLCLMDVDHALDALIARADCWFLDGFAPARNPAMWSDNLFKAMARLSNVGAAVATYTAAGAVRRGLESQGFSMRKQPGFGPKRELLVGQLITAPRVRERAPWFRPPEPSTVDNRVIVVGAGIAGAQAAWHLAVRGWQVDVIERQVRPAMEASGNPAAIVSPRVTAKPSVAEQFSVQAYLYQLTQFGILGLEACGWNPCGALQLAVSDEKSSQWQSLGQRNLPESLLECLDADHASLLAGTAITLPSIHYPGAGFVLPGKLIATLLQHDRINVSVSTAVAAIDRLNGQWQATDKRGKLIARAPVTIIASGSFLEFNQTSNLPHTAVQGQTSLAATTAASAALRTIIQHDGYITPGFNGQHLLGASYRRYHLETGLEPAVDQENMATITRHTAALAAALGPVIPAHSAIRMASANRMPYIGPVIDSKAISAQFPDLQRNQFDGNRNAPGVYPGLFISGAHGSRGFTNAALAGEMIAALICGETLPVQRRLFHALHPAKQLIRSLERNPETHRPVPPVTPSPPGD